MAPALAALASALLLAARNGANGLALAPHLPGDGRSLVLDARAIGVAVAVVATWRRLPFPVVIVVAAAATALVRAVA